MRYRISLGPFHPGWPGALRLDLEVESSVVQAVESALIRPEGLRPEDWAGLVVEEGLVGVERLCAAYAWSFTLAYCQSLEKLLDLQVPPRARFLRLALAELERPIHHLWVASKILHLADHPAAATVLLDLREEFLYTRQRLTDQRIFCELNVVGGLRRDILDLSPVDRLIQYVKGPLYRLTHRLLSDRNLASVVVGAGLLTTARAEEEGLGGPLARASAVARDLRQDQPYAAYEELDVQVVTQTGGDTFARWVVLLLEVFESLRLLESAVQNLPAGPVRLERLPQVPSGKIQDTSGTKSGFGRCNCGFVGAFPPLSGEVTW
jgi:ech hydrogenase subunit E